MSKRLTKVLSLVLTLVMFLSVSTPAFAIGGGDMGRGFGRDIGENEIRDFEPAGEIAEEEELDYFQTTVEANGSQVTVEAPMGALPTLAELRAEPVEIEDVRAAVESVLEGEANILLAMDISFWLNGIEIEPEEPVRVKISAPELEGKSYLTLVHIPDAAEPETVDLIDEENLSFALGTNEIAFEADSFSTYVVTWDGAKSATIHWGYLTDGEFTEFDDTASLDSGAGSMNLNLIFDGYLYSSAYYEFDENVYSLSSSILTKVTDNGSTSWTFKALVPVEGGEEGETQEQTLTVANGSDIYAVYVEKSAGYTPPDPSGEDVKGPITRKNVTDNHDGTYTIRLDITGQQDHSVNRIGANVIVIMDRTSSMESTISGNTSRMDAAKTALSTLIDTLNPGTGEQQNLINFTALEFYNSPNYRNGLSWTQSRTAMDDYADDLDVISGYEGSGFNRRNLANGTCWQAGLYGGIVRANEASTNDNLKTNKTYVIFVTDGNPNGWYTANNSGAPATNPNYQQSGTGQFIEQAYNAALPNAINLSALCSNRFYGIYCGGSEDDGMGHLEDLMNYTDANGHAVNGTFIDGSSETAIVNAFKGIAQTIVNDLGASEVVVDDGIPTLANVSAAVSGSAGGFKYYIKPANGEETVWTDAPSAGYTSGNGVTWDLSKAGVLADGTTYSLEFTVWPTQAAYDMLANLSNQLPGWKLDELDDKTLEQLVVTVDNVDYEYTPGETEGSGKWAPSGSTSGGMSTADFLALIETATTVEYNILTNTHLTTTYKYGEDTYTDPPVGGTNSGAMILDTTYFGVHKVWNNGMDFRTANALTKEVDEKRYIVDPDDNFILDDGGNRIEYNSSNPDSRTWFKIDLIITEDGEKYTEITLYSKEYNGNSAWSWNKMYIAPGVLTHDKNAASGELTILEAGRDYSVKEQPGESYYWNLSAEIYHPMVINGTAYVLQLVKDNPPEMDNNTFDGDYYNIDGKVYKKLGTADSALITAVNDRRSMLYVTKKVEAAQGTTAPEDALFTFEIKMDCLTDPHPNDADYDDYYNTFWFAIQTDPKDRATIIIPEENDDPVVDGAEAEVKNGNLTGFYWFDNGGTVKVSIKAGQYIVFTNLPLNTKYDIKEIIDGKIPEGFVFTKAETAAVGNNVDGVTYNPTPGTVDAELVSGTIDESNSDYSATYTNTYLGYFYVYHSSDLSVERFPMAVNGVAYKAASGDDPAVTFDIFALKKADTLYGGYYSDYAGKSASFDAATLDYSGENDPVDAGGQAYTYAAIKGDDTTPAITWDWEQAYKVKGTEMIPEAGLVYYLKEVPTGYMLPYTHYSYFKDESKALGNVWAISATDDLNYQEAGFVVIEENMKATMLKSMTINTVHGGTSVTLTPNKVFKAKGVLEGYLGYVDITSFKANNAKIMIRQYWVSPDGIYDFGITMRELSFGDCTILSTGIKKTDMDYKPLAPAAEP